MCQNTEPRLFVYKRYAVPGNVKISLSCAQLAYIVNSSPGRLGNLLNVKFCLVGILTANYITFRSRQLCYTYLQVDGQACRSFCHLNFYSADTQQSIILTMLYTVGNMIVNYRLTTIS